MEQTVNIITLDIGTTTIRCHLLNQKAETVYELQDQVHIIYPNIGYVEIDPAVLWNQIVNLIKRVVKESGVNLSSIRGMGISTQRSTFVTWRKDTGEYLHNLITWKDLRSDQLVNSWNKSLTMRTIRAGAYCLFMITRIRRFLAVSTLKFTNVQTTLRLAWALQNVPELQQAVKEKQAMFGTLDTWLLYKLTHGKTWATDITNVSATGFFDPFILDKSKIILSLFKIPSEILPPVVDNNHDFGVMHASIVGQAIPIKCVMADQSASLFGSNCFNVGDLKITLGTGGFLNVNTGKSPHASIGGLYPVIAWKMGKELCYMAEGSCLDTGSLILWAQNIGLCASAEETSRLAYDVQSNDGVYFVPAFSGLNIPGNDMKAATTFIGLKPTTNKAHMVRAILESIGFRIYSLFKVLKKETPHTFKKVTIDGGVSKNDFVCQLISDLTALRVERLASTEMGIMGVTFMTGLSLGIWKSPEALKHLRIVEHEFNCEKVNYVRYKEIIKQWSEAIDRSKSWY